MGAAFPFNPARLAFTASPLPVLVRKEEEPGLPAATRRTRLWELSDSLHCSVIGTCLSAAELRRVLGKANLAALGTTEHELHGQGVTLAGKHAAPAKLIHKALDERHRLAVKKFERAKTEDEVRALWAEARAQGDIPGAYWALLTHPAATHALIREAFGDVHMLSHLVGAANRADIRRLSQLEADKAELEDKVQRQQRQMHELVRDRDARIAALGALLVERNDAAADAAPDPDGGEALAGLVADLQRRLDAAERRRDLVEARWAQARAELSQLQASRDAAERRAALLADELEALEASLAPVQDEAARDEAARDKAAAVPPLDGLSILYVGGHPSLVSHMRAASEAAGAAFAHHDGGVDERNGLLAGLVGRADLVLFPVDCISHDAALTVKRLCRQLGTPFRPLRSGGFASFAAALRRPAPAVSEPA